MSEFLSPEWLAALFVAAAGDEGLSRATAEDSLVVEQRILADPDPNPGSGPDPGTGADPDQPEVARYHFVFDHGRVEVIDGPADDPTIRFSLSESTARAIAAGRESAQRAFMTGMLQVGGDLRVLLDRPALMEALGRTFAGTGVEAEPTPTGSNRTSRS